MNTQASITGPGWRLDSEYTSLDGQELNKDLANIDDLLDQAETLNQQLHGSVATAQQLAKLSEQVSTLLNNVST